MDHQWDDMGSSRSLCDLGQVTPCFLISQSGNHGTCHLEVWYLSPWSMDMKFEWYNVCKRMSQSLLDFKMQEGRNWYINPNTASGFYRPFAAHWFSRSCCKIRRDREKSPHIWDGVNRSRKVKWLHQDRTAESVPECARHSNFSLEQSTWLVSQGCLLGEWHKPWHNLTSLNSDDMYFFT